MCDLTIVNPTDHPLPIGFDLNTPIELEDEILGVYDDIGSGTLTNYDATTFTCFGTYETFGFSGSWNLSITTAGSQWLIIVSLTGAAEPYSREFTANCSLVSSDPPTLNFQDINSGDTVNMSQYYSAVSHSKIQFSPSWSEGHSLFVEMP